MRQTYLHSDWFFNNVTELPPYVQTAVQYEPWLPATVPGHVHLDLVENGIISDPFLRMNELGSRWVDEADWAYKTSFPWTADAMLPKRLLKFEGLDTVCKVRLNGSVVGEFDNMFVPVEIDVSEILVEGTNELEIVFSSAVRVGTERRKHYFETEGIAEDCKQFDERAFVRKAQYMSAWDWGPRLVSCGIWRPVSLVEFAARIKSFTVFQTPIGDGTVHVTSETIVDGSGDITLSFGDEHVESHSSTLKELDLIVSHPLWWWPNGMGEQHLYPASAAISDGNEVKKRIGLRTIYLERDPDSVGETFTFIVNGKKLWARGANWIPNDSFPSRVTREDYRLQAESCKELGMNMLRVWGGGLYELEDFYDACDEAGLLVWQDFMYACSYYPDGQAACEIAKMEATMQIERLRDRTSLALWCANNENLTMWQGKWGGAQSPSRYYGENIYNQVLPELIKQLDPQRSYIPSSPIGQADPNSGDCNQGKFGDSHYWDVWHGRGDWRFYKDSDTRFSSEFGFASSCSLAQWQTAIIEADWRKDSPVVRWHDKTGKEWDKFHGYVTTHYPVPETLEDWTYYSQLNQRDALRFGIEHWRRADDCQGSLIWQFNDCWPVQSWAVQDYLRLIKPAGYELKRLYADRLVSLVREEGVLSVYLVNDGETIWDASFDLRIFSLKDGAELLSKPLSSQVQVGARVLVDQTEINEYPNAIAQVGAATALLSEPKECQLAEPDLNFEIGDHLLTVAVKGIVVDLVLIDLDSPENLKPADSTLSGAEAKTVIDGSASYTFTTEPKRLLVQFLHGRKIVALS